MLEAGAKAPEFELESDSGKTIRLSELRGRKVVLYFYPKDDTPGCTTEACELRDRFPEIEEKNATVLGVSPDGVKSHQRFKAKHELPFTLLSDPDHAVADAYGAWGEKKRFGKTYEGILRSTFVIDEDGVIEKVFAQVKPKGHGDEVVQALGD
ncbi:MAG: thioredoxin-dependent thiol peroxidase [Gemmatimonadetes bacterium]|uniref:thioredoxin-dependent peroxiredoxin n=1 Tax=Candidatus Kutchimonas denitrificans TaxID=3056748 RepID=A0AAE5C7Y9_9BACT|nr:thioredoxin-dependent thiol peroxidase [Gemmatimonadota bacterium]NIR73996.1 thioredoxin-dependent thiol peroxidase [Candidatus Kutchimonas denitrificans]NIS02985.1 thioredoxin-dependent thiol peroxidase [Gemmatimonadota bacterium]NIT68702.1 thioredoxin-dependent thiol peroxidase [Gemmatimonadota bacterium]NIU53283.1 thioredoxin-dependent thiol peroxidase [Gemmatimonadota bacterium]